MKCPHCHVEFHAETHRSVIVENERSQWLSRHCECPACLQTIIELGRRKDLSDFTDWSLDWRLVEPLGAKRKISEDVPRRIADDFAEACAVLKASPKASAALSRRCLEIILTDHGYAGANLARQVEAVLNETDSSKSLPSSVHTVVDLIRNFGNFSAHPIPDKTSQTIIDVEPEEAETCLDILEALFDHYYVRPAAAKRMKDALNAKLATAGKPPAK